MQPTDKFRTDLDHSLKRFSVLPQGAKLNGVREFFFRYFPHVADDAKAALFMTFVETWESSPERATAWLAGVGSILLMDYDGTVFSPAEWRDIRDSLAAAQNELDMDLLSYALSLVVEHGAL